MIFFYFCGAILSELFGLVEYLLMIFPLAHSIFPILRIVILPFQ